MENNVINVQPLNWNSRTADALVKADPCFKEILDSILNRDQDKFVLGFYSSSNYETLRFIDKLKGLVDARSPDGFLWMDREIRFLNDCDSDEPDQFIRDIEVLEDYRKGVIAVFEPIDYGCTVPVQSVRKLEFHGDLISALYERDLCLLVFENITFEFNQYSPNSPLNKHVKAVYKIPEYRETEIPVLRRLKENVVNDILRHCSGNFDIVKSLEDFWEDINLEGCVEDLVNRFLEIPIRSKIEQQVFKKLCSLELFLKNNRRFIDKQVAFDDTGIGLKSDPDLESYKAYFDKTALFETRDARGDVSENGEGEAVRYRLTPKKVFKDSIIKSGFLSRKLGRAAVEDRDDKSKRSLEQQFEDIAGLFSTRKPMFLLGAGTSLKSGAPNHFDLLRKMTAADKDVSPGTLMETYARKMKIWSSFDVRKKMIPLLGELKPSIGHFYLARLVKERRTDVILTTNFDTLIEDSLMDFGIRSSDFVKLVGSGTGTLDWEWVNGFSENTLKIFKICGDLFHGKRFALKTGDANRYIDKAVEALESILKTPERNTFIVLGHGLKEDKILDLIFRYSNEETRVVYVNLTEFEPGDNFENIKGVKNWVANKGIGSEAGVIELIDPHYGQFDYFMAKLNETLR